MAKFNTLAGGYYGKLGATVGQRWKNLRTVRSYVIPANPQTEVQQANRRRFSDCVWYAQIAQQVNPKTTAFDTTAATLWNCRMSTARALQDLELTEMDRIPLYPTTLSLPNTISAASVTRVIDTTHAEVTVTGVELSEERVLVMLVLLPGAESWKNRLALCIGSNGDEGGNVFTFRIPEGVTLADGMKARFCSCDDVSSATDLIASAQINLPMNAIDIHTFDTTVTNVSRSGNTYTFTFAEDFNNGTNAVSGVSLYGVINGAFASENLLNATLINQSGKFALVAESAASDNQDLPALATGSKLRIASISSLSATVQATAENTEDSVISDDLTRTYKNTVTSVSRDGSTYTFNFSRAFPTIGTKSGAFTGRAVVNGAFTNLAFTGYTVSGSSLVWASGLTASQNLPAFATGSWVKPNVTIVSNGVTYSPETSTNQSITNADLSRTYDNTISSVSRSGKTFTFTFATNFPTASSMSGTPAIRAVVKGAFANQNLTGATFGAKTITWTSSATVEEEVPAFATGSTITANVTLSSNGVSYAPQVTTAQSLTNDDLTRTIETAPTFSQTNGAGSLAWNFNAALPTVNESITVELRATDHLYFEDFNVNTEKLYNNGTKLCYDLKEDYDYTLYLTGCYIKPASAKGFTLNGVTYNLGVREYYFDSNGFDAQVELDTTITVNGDSWSFDVLDNPGHAENGFSAISLYGFPYNVEVSDYDGNTHNFTMASENEVILDSSEVLLAVNVTNGESVTELDDPTVVDDYSIGLRFTFGGKNWDVDLMLRDASTFDW